MSDLAPNYSVRESYEESLMVYPNLKSSIDTSWEEGKTIGEGRGFSKGILHVARNMIEDGESDQKISRYTDLTIKDILKLRKDW
ncbi:MAG: hypothetical protein ACOC4C_05815 [Fibrobacterota bacterium]